MHLLLDHLWISSSLNKILNFKQGESRDPSVVEVWCSATALFPLLPLKKSWVLLNEEYGEEYGFIGSIKP